MSSDNLLSSASLNRSGSLHRAGEPSQPFDNNSSSQVFVSVADEAKPPPPSGPIPSYARPSLPQVPPAYATVAALPQPPVQQSIPPAQPQSDVTGAQNGRELAMFLRGIQQRHSHAGPVVEAVQMAAVELDRHVDEKKESTQRLTDFELTVGLLLPEEHMLNGINMIPFSKAEFLDQAAPNFASTLARTKYNGRLYLTNKRLLFLSSNFADQGIKCSTVDNPKRAPGKYLLEKTYKDNSWFFPVHAHDVKHIEIDLGLQSRHQMEVQGQIPCLFACVPCCPKVWFSQASIPTPDELQSELRIAVYLPPWGLRHQIVLNVEGVPPSTLREFVRVLEGVCPALAQPSGPRP